MLKRTALALVVVALVGAADASARIPSSSSDVFILEFVCVNCSSSSGFLVRGAVTSRNAKCEGNRSVEIIAKTSLLATPKYPVDTARSSDHGSWSGSGVYPHPLDTLHHLKATMAPKKIGPRGHRHLCEGDTDSYFPDA